MNWTSADPPVVRPVRSQPDQYPDEALGAARGAVCALGITGLVCAVLPFIGWLLGGLRYP